MQQSKPQLTLTNLVYGDFYIDVFLDYHLKSLIEDFDPSVFDPRSRYLIYTDKFGEKRIRKHVNFARAAGLLNISFVLIDGGLSYENRYQMQTVQLRHSVETTLPSGGWLAQTAADIYFGKGYFRSLSMLMSLQGIDAVCGSCFRTGFEGISDLLQGGQLEIDELFAAAFSTPHPIWMSANWRSPYFTRIPYQMIWSDDNQIIVRGFSISPFAFIPNALMLSESGCSDMSLLKLFKSPYFVKNWSDMPIVELGQLKAFYPIFENKIADVANVARWAATYIPKENYRNIFEYFSLKPPGVRLNDRMLWDSEAVADRIYRILAPTSVDSRPCNIPETCISTGN